LVLPAAPDQTADLPAFGLAQLVMLQREPRCPYRWICSTLYGKGVSFQVLHDYTCKPSKPAGPRGITCFCRKGWTDLPT